MRSERGSALVTAVLVVATMLVLGTAMLSVVDTQTEQTRAERTGDATFNLAEAALNAEAFLLGRNWPQSTAQMPSPSGAASPCSGQTMTGTLADPPASATPSLRDQVQRILAQTYTGTTTAAEWWVTACQDGGRTAWDASLLDGLAYDPTVASDPSARPRRMWVRAEARIGNRRRAVAALVQAGQQPALPTSLAVVTGKLGADLRTTANVLVEGQVVAPLLGSLVGGERRTISGAVGLRCSVLDQDELGGCLQGVYKATSMTTVAPLLQANDFVDFRSDTAMSAEQLALLRQQAQASGTYFPRTSAGAGSVDAGAPCLPAGSAGKIVFIEQVGDGTGSCVLDTAPSGAAAKALVVGSGGVRVRGGGTFTGVIYALHRTALAGGAADVRIEGGSKVVGGVFADDNPDLDSGSRHGVVEIVPPPIDIAQAIAPLPVCQNILTSALCVLPSVLTGPLDGVLSTLGISAATLAGAIMPQLDAHNSAITYDEAAVKAVSTFGDSAIVPGTFRQLAPMF
jgi:hypothetical protein